MLTLLGITIFVLAILASIGLHELGHLMPAKRFGVKATEYFVGFGPTVWSTRRGETEYGLKAIPFGGYVRMIGMFPPRPDGTVRSSSTGRLGLLVEQARKESEADVLTEEDRKRTFYNLSVPKKLTVMFGGPVMNLLIAVLLFTVMFVGFGLPAPSLTVANVTPCAPSSATDDGTCQTGELPSAAAAAGITPGDTITAVNGQQVSSWEEFTEELRSVGAGNTVVTVERDGQSLALPVELALTPRPVIVDGEDTGRTEMRPFLGVGPSFVLQPQPLTAVPGEVWDLTVRSAVALATFPAKLAGVAGAAFSDGERDPEGPIGVVGASRISGDVAAADLPSSWKVAQLIGIIASVNLFLFLFNMIPLLPLDGGHIAGALYEGARRKVATLRGQPDPGPVDVARLLPVAYGVAILLIGISVLLLYADIVSPVRIT
ncbi:MAG: site-2 protease family protein [Actinobacteria bacterium]|nr:site-2 protease family protein [Actinomycetota bacterium]